MTPSPAQLAPIELLLTWSPSRCSGISAFARASRPSLAAAASRRALRPAALRLPALQRLASTSSVGDGKIYQVIGTPPPPWRGPRILQLTAQLGKQVPSSMVSYHNTAKKAPAAPRTVANPISTVKFDTEKLPSILNALTTDNNGQKLVLEVSVRQAFQRHLLFPMLTSPSNISERASCAALPWTVGDFASSLLRGVSERFFYRYRGSRPWCEGDRQ